MDTCRREGSQGCLVPRRLSLSLNENLRTQEGGKKRTGVSLFYPSHGPLRFVTSYSRFASACTRNHAKNEAPKEEADPGGYSYFPTLEGYNSAI